MQLYRSWDYLDTTCKKKVSLNTATHEHSTIVGRSLLVPLARLVIGNNLRQRMMGNACVLACMHARVPAAALMLAFVHCVSTGELAWVHKHAYIRMCMETIVCWSACVCVHAGMHDCVDLFCNVRS